MYLSRYAKDVQIVVRRDSLRDSMSHYLDRADRKDAKHPAAGTDAELERVEGDGRVERVALKLQTA